MNVAPGGSLGGRDRGWIFSVVVLSGTVGGVDGVVEAVHPAVAMRTTARGSDGGVAAEEGAEQRERERPREEPEIGGKLRRQAEERRHSFTAWTDSVG